MTLAGLSNDRVVESKHDKYAVGKIFFANCGWRERFVINPDDNIEIHPALDTGTHPVSLNIGVLGMPGSVHIRCITKAYFHSASL